MLKTLLTGLPLLALPLLAVQRAARQAQISEHLATHDPLTGLPNRAKFYARLGRAIATAEPDDTIALPLVDLDRFKEINDTLGHHYGDEVLRQVARRLRHRIGQDSIVARLGGDEFAILLPGLKSADAALEIAEEARRSLTAPLDVAGIRLDLGGSVGVATFPDDGNDVETLMQRADIAMYEAKSGRTGVERYSREQDANSLLRLTIAGDLPRALEQGEFVTHFQPKVNLASNRVSGAEALVRWHHPLHGTIPPEVFVSIAEQTGFIVPLTMHVLDEAVRACSEWRRHGARLAVAVNLSARVLLEPRLPQQVADICRAHDLPPNAVVLEITENMVVADLDRVLPTLTRLAANGFALSIDHFGTGYSSLEYLKLLPVSELKIDRGFVIGMRSDPRNAAIVRSAVHLGRSLGLQVVAEGSSRASSTMSSPHSAATRPKAFTTATRSVTRSAVLGGRLRRRRAGRRHPPPRAPGSISRFGQLGAAPRQRTPARWPTERLLVERSVDARQAELGSERDETQRVQAALRPRLHLCGLGRGVVAVLEWNRTSRGLPGESDALHGGGQTGERDGPHERILCHGESLLRR